MLFQETSFLYSRPQQHVMHLNFTLSVLPSYFHAGNSLKNLGGYVNVQKKFDCSSAIQQIYCSLPNFLTLKKNNL